MNIFEQDEVITAQLPWRVTCALACKALILGLSLEEIMVLAISEKVERDMPQGDKHE